MRANARKCTWGNLRVQLRQALFDTCVWVLYKLCYNLSVIIGAFISHERGGVQSWKIHYKNCEPTETFAKDRSISTKSGQSWIRWMCWVNVNQVERDFVALDSEDSLEWVQTFWGAWGGQVSGVEQYASVLVMKNNCEWVQAWGRGDLRSIGFYQSTVVQQKNSSLRLWAASRLTYIL